MIIDDDIHGGWRSGKFGVVRGTYSVSSSNMPTVHRVRDALK